MIALVQRVSSASVRTNAIGPGMVVLLGVSLDDTEADLKKIAAKLVKLRIFADKNGKMNLDIGESDGEMLLISQFTLLADTRGGNRPSFIKAALPDRARELYEKLARQLVDLGMKIKTGFFGEYMTIATCLDGPVTIYLDSEDL